jgi:hypothetical protein
MTELLIALHNFQKETFPTLGGEHWFLIESLILTAILCKWGIPITTNLMVNASAGLAAKYFGKKSRTLVINASTNNPELANMAASLALNRAGGVANPLGSNFANIYLMYLLAPLWIALKWTVKGDTQKVKALGSLLLKEKKLLAGHIGMASLLFVFSTVAYWALTGTHQLLPSSNTASLQGPLLLTIGLFACLGGVLAYKSWEKKQKKKRPELYDDICDDGQVASWKMFALGTIGLIAASLLLNGIFLAWSELYGSSLQGILGTAVFAGLHYFLGALVTSLPELHVAISNYEKLSSPDLNTALASASASNMINLGIAALGILVILLLGLSGISQPTL